MNQFDKACLTCPLLFCDDQSLRCPRRRAKAAYKANWRARNREQRARLTARSKQNPAAQRRADAAMAVYVEAIREKNRCQ